MRVLLTGNEGYIGAVMGPFLAQAGHEIVGLDTGFYAEQSHGPEPTAFPTRHRDLRDLTIDDVQGVDAVIHLAALSNDPLGDLDESHTYDINQHASLHLAELAKQAGVTRFLYASSCSVYGATGTDAALDESASLAPVTAYAISKVRVESDLAAIADDTFSPVYLRNATAYGWSPRLRTDIVLNDLVARAMNTGKVTVLSDGTPWRPIVHIEDISRAFLCALEADRDAVHDQAFNVGVDTENYRVAEIAEIVADEVPGAVVEITGDSGPDPRSYKVDFGKIQRHLPGYLPRWTARDGARELHEAYQRLGMPETDFSQRYRRLPVLTRLLAEERLDPSLRWT